MSGILNVIAALTSASLLVANTETAAATQPPPTVVATEAHPCALWHDDQSLVDFQLRLIGQNRSVPMRLPRAFLEQPEDLTEGAIHTAQRVRARIADFAPLDTGDIQARIDRGERDWMSIVFLDLLPPDRVLALKAEEMGAAAGQPLAVTSGPHQLAQVAVQASHNDRQLYFDGAAEAPEAVIDCRSGPVYQWPLCQLFFLRDGVSVSVTFARFELANWALLRQRVAEFLACAREN